MGNGLPEKAGFFIDVVVGFFFCSFLSLKKCVDVTLRDCSRCTDYSYLKMRLENGGVLR